MLTPTQSGFWMVIAERRLFYYHSVGHHRPGRKIGSALNTCWKWRPVSLLNTTMNNNDELNWSTTKSSTVVSQRGERGKRARLFTEPNDENTLFVFNRLFMKKGSKVWRGLISVPSFPTPSYFRMEGCEWQRSCIEHANGWVRHTHQPFCPLTLFPSSQKTDPLTTPPQHRPLHTPITHQCAKAELLLHGAFRMQAGRLRSYRCLHLSSPKMIPHWGKNKIQVSAWHHDIMSQTAARPLGRYSLLKGHKSLLNADLSLYLLTPPSITQTNTNLQPKASISFF